MPLPFESVREQLLRAGIAPRHATRYVIELREHLVDLTARERSAGVDAKTAVERARAMLGTDAQLVQTMIDKTPRSLASRAPWAMFALLPVVGLIAIMAITGIAMFQLLAPVHGTWPGGVPNTYTGLITVVSFLSRFVVGPVLAAGCIALALRQRLSSNWLWIGLALIALFSGLFGFRMSVYPHGGAAFGMATVALVDGRPNAAATLALVGVRAAMLFALAALAYRVLQTKLSRVDHA